MIKRTRVRKGTSKTLTTQRRRTQSANEEEMDNIYDMPITMKEKPALSAAIILWGWHYLPSERYSPYREAYCHRRT